MLAALVGVPRRTRVSCATDEQGRFELAGLGGELRLFFQTTRPVPRGTTSRTSSPAPELRPERAAERGRDVALDPRRRGERNVCASRVRFRARGGPSGSRTTVSSSRGGSRPRTARCSSADSARRTITNAQGEFAIDLLAATTISVRVYTPWTPTKGRAVLLERTLTPAELAGTLRLVVP
jgi:hypothetical protein